MRLARPACALLVLLLGLSLAQAQPFPRPRLSSLSPCGAKAGTTVEATLFGTFLDEPTALHFSDPRIKAELLPPPPPPRKGTAPPAPVRFKITVPAEAPLGTHDVYLVARWGISNPRAFVVGDRPEAVEKEPNNKVPEAQEVALGTVVNGSIAASTDVDYYSFKGKKGERVVVHCAASSIDSRLHPLIELFGDRGAPLASNHDYDERDALLDVKLPADGTYRVRVSSFAYLFGRADEAFYRLSISTAPWVDSVFPPALEKGKPAEATLFGRNLPGAKPAGAALEKLAVRVAPGRQAFTGPLLPCSASVEAFEYRVRNAAGTSNPVLLTEASGPIVLASGNGSPEKALPVKSPCTICGRMGTKLTRHWYEFSASKGEVLIFEGFADRIGSPLDLYLKLQRADTGQQVQEADGHLELPTPAGQLSTFTNDPKMRFVVPADGKYRLLVGTWSASPDRPGLPYRVDLRPERPDFVLIAATGEEGGGLVLSRGGHQDVVVACVRQEGFDGEVLLEAEGLPPGVTCKPQAIGPRARQTSLVLSAEPGAALGVGEIKIKGTALVGATKVTQWARPAAIVWTRPQRNLPALSRLTRSLPLAVRDKGPFTLGTEVSELAVAVGGRVQLKVMVNRQWKEFEKAAVQVARVAGPVQANGLPINIPPVNVPAGKSDALINLQVPTNAPAGTYSLVLVGRGKFNFQPDPKDKRRANFDAVEAAPAVKVTVYKSMAQLALATPNVVLSPGGAAPLVVNIKRLYGYKGPFKLDVVAPPGTGVSALSVNVPAGAVTARAELRAAPGAKPGTSAGYLARLTASVGGASLTEEARFQVTVSKASTPGSPGGAYRVVKLLEEGAAGWKYRAASAVKGDAWLGLMFNEAGWAAGKAPLGYGETEIAKRKGTTIALTGQPVLFRREVEVPAALLAQKGALFRLAVASDDSATVYINGKLADQDPVADHEFKYWNREVALSAALFRPGKNIIAVRVKNTPGSSDLYLDVELTASVPRPKKK